MPLQGSPQHCVVPLAYTCPTDNHDINTPQYFLMLTKTLADNAFDAVPHHGRFGGFAGNSQTETGKPQLIGTGQNGEVRV
jgi:hypothetical protein